MVKIGIFKVTSHNGVGHIMTKADNFGAYTVESEKRGVGYVFDTGEIAIVTSQGYIRMDEESACKMIEELQGVLEDVKDLRRMGVAV